MDYISKYIGEKTELESKKWGKLLIEVASFTPAKDGDLIVLIGNPFNQKKPLIRIHSECVFAEVFESNFCDCGEQFELSMDELVKEGNGILFYLRFDGRGAGLAAKVKATALEMQGIDTYESRLQVGVKPEGRDFSSIGKYLKGNGIGAVRLLTNNPTKGKHLENEGISVSYIPLLVQEPNENVRKLYDTKLHRFHHCIPNELT